MLPNLNAWLAKLIFQLGPDSDSREQNFCDILVSQVSYKNYFRGVLLSDYTLTPT
jgi:hypothetical protein